MVIPHTCQPSPCAQRGTWVTQVETETSGVRTPTLRQTPFPAPDLPHGFPNFTTSWEARTWREETSHKHVQLPFALGPGRSEVTFRPDHAVPTPYEVLLIKGPHWAPHPSECLLTRSRGCWPGWRPWREEAGSVHLECLSSEATIPHPIPSHQHLVVVVAS